MLENWLLMPRWLMFSSLAVVFVTTGAIIFALSFSPWVRSHALRYIGVVPPYVNVLAVLLALITGFVATDTWERQKHARRIIQSEADNVLAIYDLSIAAKTDLTKLRDVLRKYVAAVINDEWPKMAEGQESVLAGDALGLLMIRVSSPKIGADAGATVQTALLQSAMKLRSDRGARLALNGHESDHAKWLVLLILGALTQCAIGIVHLERSRAQAAALVIFTAGLISTVGLIAEHEWPFEGESAIQPTPLRLANERIWKGGSEFTGALASDEDIPIPGLNSPGSAPTPATPK